MNKPYFIDELAHAGPEHLDTDFVAGYDRKQAFDPASDLAVLRGLGLSQSSALVDLGSGTGRFALAAAREFGQVISVDISPAMLDYQRTRAREAGLANLSLVHAGFLTYEHVEPLADAVYTRNALHHLPDFWKAIALKRLAAILRPGGILRVHDLIYDFSPSDAEQVFDRWLAGAATDPSRGYTREDLAEHIRTEHSTYRWLFEPMLVAAGFKVLSVEYRGSVYGAYTCVKP
ncbi:MAG TPA: class I SAM-dependent methyltransferase [Chloroflexota bacterium]|nr:class I SAM-dependent methyltransferase [Chloroflexota bacterium]